MNLLTFRNGIYFIGLVVFFGIRHVYMERTQREQKSVSRVDALERVLLASMLPTILLLPLTYLFSPFLNFANYSQPTSIHWLGLGGRSKAL